MTATLPKKPTVQASGERIVLMRPYVPPAAIAAVAEVLQSRWIGEGPKVRLFEERFHALTGRPSVAVGSCTDALHLAYLLAGVQPGDTVIAPVFTCTAANEALLYCGAKIKFCDVAPDSLNMDPRHAMKLAAKDKIAAVATVHYGGMPMNLAALSLLGLPIIEDCAQALGSPAVGYSSFAACYSFQAVKHMTTGDGGMLTLKNQSLVPKAKRLRWFGIDREAKLNGTWANDITEVGYKYQMTDIAAAMGLAGLDALYDQMAHRRALHARYATLLAGVDGIRILDTDSASACWLMTVLVERRENFRRMLAAQSIESDQVHYRNDRYSIFKDFRGKFPHMDAIDPLYCCLPMHAHLSLDDVDRVCEAIRGGW